MYSYLAYAVHGFSCVTYDVMEGDRLDTCFQLNITTPGLIIAGNITAMAGGTAGESMHISLTPVEAVATAPEFRACGLQFNKRVTCTSMCVYQSALSAWQRLTKLQKQRYYNIILQKI